MQPRVLAGLIAFALVFAVSAHRSPVSAQASPYPFFQNDVDERYTGGAPRGRYFSVFGGSSVARTTVNVCRARSEPGTIIINTGERRLYYILPDGRAIRYGIGVGRDGFTWRGVKTGHRQEGMAGLDAAGADAVAAGRTCRATCRRS
jgi:lipoprotein-anchoring transpeptidase ErfK/SrfK